MRWLRRLFSLPVAIAVAGAIGWAGLALWFDGPTSRFLAGALAMGFVATALATLIFLRPMRRALGAFLVLWVAVLGWWLRIPPRADRDWQPDVARPATAEIHGDVVTIHNVRDFDYRSETDSRNRSQSASVSRS